MDSDRLLVLSVEGGQLKLIRKYDEIIKKVYKLEMSKRNRK